MSINVELIEVHLMPRNLVVQGRAPTLIINLGTGLMGIVDLVNR